jgi:hypothetical protein
MRVVFLVSERKLEGLTQDAKRRAGAMAKVFQI